MLDHSGDDAVPIIDYSDDNAVPIVDCSGMMPAPLPSLIMKAMINHTKLM